MGSLTTALVERLQKLAASGDAPSVQEQLRTMLKHKAVRVIDRFREWDEDQSGYVDKKEFRKGVATLGYHVPQSEVDAIFDSIDVNRSGTLDLGAGARHRLLALGRDDDDDEDDEQ